MESLLDKVLFVLSLIWSAIWVAYAFKLHSALVKNLASEESRNDLGFH